MNYEKLVGNLRRKAYDYNDDKAEQFSRILSEAKRRKIANYRNDKEWQKAYAKKEERWLFRTR